MKSIKITDVMVEDAFRAVVPLTSLFNPDSRTELLQDCLEQYHNRISTIRVLIGKSEHYGAETTRQSILLARRFNIPTSTRVESSNLVVTRGILPIYLDLCAEVGVDRIQFRKESLQPELKAKEVLAFADERNLDVQFEVESLPLNNEGDNLAAKKMTDNAMEWLDSGAVNLVADVGERHNSGNGDSMNEIVNITIAEILASTFGLHTVMFKAPTESQQRKLFEHFGEETHICDIHLSDLPRVEKLRGVDRPAPDSFGEKSRVAFPSERWSNPRLKRRSF